MQIYHLHVIFRNQIYNETLFTIMCTLVTYFILRASKVMGSSVDHQGHVAQILQCVIPKLVVNLILSLPLVFHAGAKKALRVMGIIVKVNFGIHCRVRE